MTLTELEYYNALDAQIGDLCDKLMGNADLQLVLQTEKERQYWLANHGNTNNGVPILCLCYEEERVDGFDIDDVHDWYEFRNKVFELMTSEQFNIIECYLEHV